ncbi:mitochondrial carrier domain-containing protein [Rhizoctonia solani]|nr:mitochondrial carrier domain-containing protein [Rhizoctonia solani]
MLSSSRGQEREQTSGDGGSTNVQESSNSLYAALARTAARGAGLYFSRPMRLFRPTKISGWTTLRHVAASEGRSLSPAFIANLIRTQGALVIPRHFIPPLLVNTCLGTILFTTYTHVYDAVHREDFCQSSTAASAIAGAAAGAIQSIAGAPAENVRLYLEGDVTGKQTSAQGWRQAWKEVFVDSSRSERIEDRKSLRQEARATRQWMREVAGMSMSRGWEGWRWNCAKDTLGFALFFATFDVSRHVATHVSHVLAPTGIEDRNSWKPFPGIHRVAQSLVLVGGGVIGGIGHELIARPFDTARRIIYIHNTHIRVESAKQLKKYHLFDPISNLSYRQTLMSNMTTSVNVLKEAIKEEGLTSFFRSTTPTSFDSRSSPYQRLQTALRTLGRVGPWGIAFVVWEATGGIST